MTQEKVIGILGGMGPEATLDLFRRIIYKTPAQIDQDHLRIIIDNNPKIPDRMAALLHGGESPVPALISTAQNLERAGADFIIIPCNTAHCYLGEMRKAVHIPIIDMIAETVAHISERNVGLLATDGTIENGIYLSACRGKEITLLYPEDQKKVMTLIYKVKAGHMDCTLKGQMMSIVDGLLKQGAQAIVAGCTEISLLLKPDDLDVLLLDPLDLLAEKTIELVKQA